MAEAQNADWSGFAPVTPQSGERDEWAGFERVDSGGEGAGSAFLSGLSGGLQEGGMSAMGATVGGVLGAPLGPVGIATGAALGGTGGMLAGQIMRRQTVGDLQDVPENVRPYAVGGEIMGGGLPFAAAPIALGRIGARLPDSGVGTFINNVLETAAAKPLSFIGNEMAMLGSAAIAGGTSEAYAPGKALPRLGAEIVGGMLNPARAANLLAQYVSHRTTAFLGSFSRAAKETKAAKVLTDIVKEAGEDPAALAALLRESGIPGADLTAAQKTGSAALAAVEARLGKQSARFGAEAERRMQEGMQATEGMITALRGTGDPQAVRLAADMRSRQYRTMLGTLVQTAEADAIRSARGITSDPQSARAAISRQARESLDTVLTEARQAESDLWGRIPRETQASAGGLVDAYDAERARLLPEEALPAVVEGFITRMREQQTQTTVGELLRFRSRALELARDAASGANPNRNEARIFGRMAEAALDDLASVEAAGFPPGVVDDARGFSRALNETFSQGFAGQARATAGQGGDRLPAELLMRRATATGGEAADLHFDELDQATRFMSQQGMSSPASEQAVAAMQDAQERFLRLTAAEAIDPQTGRASAQRFSTILQRNEALFNRFPAVRQAVEGAIASETALGDMERLTRQAGRAVEQRAAFSQVAKFENPVDAIASAVRGKAPIKDLRGIVKVARRGGPDAVEGLKAATLDHVMSLGGQNMDPAAIRAGLFEPVRAGQPSLADVMQRAGVLSEDDIGRLTSILDAADRIASTQSVRGDLAEMAGDLDGLTDLLIRIQGARLGTAISGAGPLQGSGLIAAAAGSRYLRNLFSKLDIESTQEVLIEAAKSPEFMAMLLEKPATEAEAFRIGQNIHAYLLQAGFNFAGETLDPRQDQAQQRPLPEPQMQPLGIPVNAPAGMDFGIGPRSAEAGETGSSQ